MPGTRHYHIDLPDAENEMIMDRESRSKRRRGHIPRSLCESNVLCAAASAAELGGQRAVLHGGLNCSAEPRAVRLASVGS